MNTLTHEKTIKGLSIAVIVLSALAILGCIVGVIVVGMFGSWASTYSPSYYSYGSHFDIDDYMYYSDYYEMIAVLVGMGVVGMAWELIGSGVGLVAGTMGVRKANDPGAQKTIFGWTLAGAITALLTGRIISMTLLIIACVFAYKDNQYHAALASGTMAPCYGAPVPPAAPSGQPQVPAVQPGETAPGYPGTVAQPANDGYGTVAPGNLTVEAARPATETTPGIENSVENDGHLGGYDSPAQGKPAEEPNADGADEAPAETK